MLTSPSDPDEGLDARLHRATYRQSRQLGAAGWAAFQIADTIQRAAVDTAFDALALRPTAAGRVAAAINDQFWEALTLLPVGESPREPLSEVEENYGVFALVSDVRRALGIPAGPFPLLAALARAERLGFRALWAVEGLGHEYAANRWRRDGDAVTGMLKDPRIPRRYLNMLHAGMGLFFGERLLDGVSPRSSGAALADAMCAFEDRCTRNAADGFTGPAFESLGLVTRTWYPDMTDPLARVMSDESAGYFWHGAGRALYFLPIHAVPGVRSAWVSAEREARDPESGLNVRAGLAWATTLVNLRNPRLLESTVRLRAGLLSRDGAFAYGVRTATAMAADTSPGAAEIEAFVEYVPRDESIGNLWEEFVRRPALEGIDLARLNGRSAKPLLGRAFKYQFPWNETWA